MVARLVLNGRLAVVTAAAPGARRSLLGKLSAAAVLSRRPGRSSKLAAFAATARQHVVTVAALASVDIGAFHGGQIAGWIVTGVSLFLLDFAVNG